MLPETICKKIQTILNAEIRDQESLHGGDINQAVKITLNSGEVLFVKWNEQAPENMFETEAKGLNLLRSADTNLNIPDLLIQKNEFLVLEWIGEGGEKQDSAYKFGEQLARLHQKSHTHFGLDHDNYIGRLPQSNTQHTNWPDFFALERIEPQIKMGVEAGKLNRSVLKDAEGMYKKLGAIFSTEPPALIHGDLWSGNYMFTKTGKASIYDPATYFGHREIEIAMTRLFGGFSSNFYEGYNNVYPLKGGFDSRVNLYNLYPLLVHANLFGGSYCRQAENIIKRYA